MQELKLLKAKDQEITGEMNQWEQLTLISSSFEKKGKETRSPRREFKKARLELDEKALPSGRNALRRCWKEEYVIALL